LSILARISGREARAVTSFCVSAQRRIVGWSYPIIANSRPALARDHSPSGSDVEQINALL